MKITEKIGLIVSEAFSSPRKNSFVTTVDGKKIVLRESGTYKGVSLKGADLRGAHLNNINLEGADLSGAILVGAKMRRANLKNTKMKGAIVSGADFTGADIGQKKRVLRGVKASIAPIGIKMASKAG